MVNATTFSRNLAVLGIFLLTNCMAGHYKRRDWPEANDDQQSLGALCNRIDGLFAYLVQFLCWRFVRHRLSCSLPTPPQRIASSALISRLLKDSSASQLWQTSMKTGKFREDSPIPI